MVKLLSDVKSATGAVMEGFERGWNSTASIWILLCFVLFFLLVFKVTALFVSGLVILSNMLSPCACHLE